MDSLKKEKQSLINKIFLIIVDALSVVLCSFLGLLMRFEMDVSHIPGPYVTAVERMVPAFIAATLLIFWGAKLYHTLWRFANSRELVGIVAAVAASTVFTIIYSYFTYNAVPQKLFCDLFYLFAGLRLHHTIFVDHYTNFDREPKPWTACPEYHDHRCRRSRKYGYERACHEQLSGCPDQMLY